MDAIKFVTGLSMCISAIVGAVELTAFEKELLGRPAAAFREEVYPPEIPRAFDVHREGCPVCGDAINKHGRYAWIFDYKNPFKLKCPECGSVFPDNDYEAYRKSGFKDKSLLTGKYVDDGRGWRPEEGKPKYWFVGYYHYWRFYKDKVYLRLAEAYKRTGEPGFAIRTIAMLDKYAEQYSDYNYNKQSRYAEEVLPTYDGRILDHIQMTFTTSDFADAYMITKPFLTSGPCQELQELTGRTNEEICHNIEENMFRIMADDIMSINGKIHGNFGMDQKGLLKIAKILHAPEMAKWVTDYRSNYDLASMPLDYAIYNNIFCDGAPLEAPGYNYLWMNNIMIIYELLLENGVDELALHPFSKNIFDYDARIFFCDRFMPSSGDSSRMSAPVSNSGRDMAYRLSPNPITARLYMNAIRNNKELYEKLKSEADLDVGLKSNILPAFGIASLQNGYRPAPTAAVLSFNGYIGHRHSDKLNLDIFAENVPLMPDFGYPDSASADDAERMGFYENTLTHNTVVVDGKKQEKHSTRGRFNKYITGDFSQLVSAEAPGCYGVDEYRRDVLSCEVTPGKSIFLDVFWVKGGSQHDWFMHGCGENAYTDIEMNSQNGGTLAGVDVPWGDIYDSPVHKAMEGANRNYYGYMGSGFQYLTNVRKGKVVAGKPIVFPAETRAPFTPKAGAAVKVYPLSDGDEFFLSEGMPPRTQGNPQHHVAFLNIRRTGENLKSTYVTVFETTCDERKELEIASVERIPLAEDAGAAKITFGDQRVLYMFESKNVVNFAVDGIEFTGEAGSLLVDAKTGKCKAWLSGEGRIVYGGKVVLEAGSHFSAKVTSVGLSDGTIVFDREIPADFTGHMFRIGENSYVCGECTGNTVTLKKQCTIQGRGRITEFKNSEKTSGLIAPTPYLIRPGMSVYSGEKRDVFVGKIVGFDMEHSIIDTDVPLDMNVDYWISTCGPAEDAFFPTSAEGAFDTTPVED